MATGMERHQWLGTAMASSPPRHGESGLARQGVYPSQAMPIWLGEAMPLHAMLLGRQKPRRSMLGHTQFFKMGSVAG